jgi:hypothetical protein
MAAIPAIKAANGIKKRKARGRIEAARQKSLGIAAQARALKTPQTANNNEPERILAKAPPTLTRASGRLKLGGKLCGTANRSASVRCPEGSL